MRYGANLGTIASVVWAGDTKSVSDIFVFDIHLGFGEGGSNYLNGPARKRMVTKLTLLMMFCFRCQASLERRKHGAPRQ